MNSNVVGSSPLSSTLNSPGLYTLLPSWSTRKPFSVPSIEYSGVLLLKSSTSSGNKSWGLSNSTGSFDAGRFTSLSPFFIVPVVFSVVGLSTSVPDLSFVFTTTSVFLIWFIINLNVVIFVVPPSPLSGSSYESKNLPLIFSPLNSTNTSPFTTSSMFRTLSNVISPVALSILRVVSTSSPFSSTVTNVTLVVPDSNIVSNGNSPPFIPFFSISTLAFVLPNGIFGSGSTMLSAGAFTDWSEPIFSPISKSLGLLTFTFSITFIVILTVVVEPSAKLISTAIVCFPGLDVSISALGFTLASAGRFVIASL